jgi:hypothetical protein
MVTDCISPNTSLSASTNCRLIAKPTCIDCTETNTHKDSELYIRRFFSIPKQQLGILPNSHRKKKKQQTGILPNTQKKKKKQKMGIFSQNTQKKKKKQQMGIVPNTQK